MKKIALFGFIIFALTFSAFGQKGKTKVDPTKDVRAVFDRLVEGIKQVRRGKSDERL